MDKELRFLRDFYPIVGETPRGEFLGRFPSPLLIQVREGLELAEGEPRFSTAEFTGKQLQSRVNQHLRQRGGALVFQISKRPGNVFQDMISVGRPQNNDIVLPYASVSKFHAYFAQDKASQAYRIVDAKSTNGTFLNGERLDPEKPYPVSDGDVIAFSQQLSFVLRSPGTFYDWVKGLLDLTRFRNP